VQTLGGPVLFVLLWSTGFVGARLGMPHAEPMTFLALRFALTAALLGLAALLLRAAWPPRPADWGHLAVAGLLMHGVYLGGVFVAIRLGLEAGLSALIVSLQPLLVAATARVFLGERVPPRACSAWRWGSPASS
jgi:drug/metabolite transporter (DMT)-like permease